MCVCEGKRSTPLKDLARLSDSPPNSSSGHRHTPGSAPRSAAAAAHSLRCMEERERERGEREEKEEGVH